MSAAGARTKGSSQVPVSRAPPRGSIASYSQRDSSLRSDIQENPAVSSVGTSSRRIRSSTAPSQSRAAPSEADERRKSSVSFKAPSVAPTDSISRRDSRPSRDYSAVNNGSINSSQLSPKDTSRGGGRISHLSGYSSQKGTTWSGSGAAPLTDRNLEVHNTQPESSVGRRSSLSRHDEAAAGGSIRGSRAPSRRYSGATAKDSGGSAMWNVDRGSRLYSASADDRETPRQSESAATSRRRSRRYSAASAADRYQDEPYDDRRESQYTSRRGYDDYYDQERSAPPKSMAKYSSRRYSAAYDDDIGGGSASGRRSVAASSDSSTSVRRPNGQSQAMVLASSGSQARRSSARSDGDWSQARTGSVTRQPSAGNRAYSEKQMYEEQSKPGTVRPRDTRTNSSVTSTSRAAPAAAAVAAGAGAKAKTEAASSKYSASRRDATEEVDKKESVSGAKSQSSAKQSQHEEKAVVNEQGKRRATFSERSRALGLVSDPFDTDFFKKPTPPGFPIGPTPPMWREKIHIVNEQMPDGQIVRDRKHTIERGRYVTAH